MDKSDVLQIRRRYQPPVTSYWADPSLTREQLNAQIAARRSQQPGATVAELTHDPALSATVALKRDHQWKREAR